MRKCPLRVPLNGMNPEEVGLLGRVKCQEVKPNRIILPSRTECSSLVFSLSAHASWIAVVLIVGQHKHALRLPLFFPARLAGWLGYNRLGKERLRGEGTDG